MTKIQNIIFDVGNVLFGYDPSYVLHQLLPNNEFHRAYLDQFLNAQIWQDLDRGVVDDDQLIKRLSHDIEDEDLDKNCRHIINDFVYHLNLIRGSRDVFLKLRQHYSMYLLSNFQAVPFSKLRELHPFLYQVKGQIISAHHHLLKPEPEIYQLLFNTYDIKPDESVFIDDLEVNIIAARKQQCHGIVFRSPDQLIDGLNVMGIVV